MPLQPAQLVQDGQGQQRAYDRHDFLAHAGGDPDGGRQPDAGGGGQAA